ncbi:MFS transporter [Streptomyces sp. NPDC008092]|uniref:MFS transporter n=1 Tax=Streptomyces sp. NPDC008092 TaxID=3364808 RepID=UPI0036EF3C40
MTGDRRGAPEQGPPSLWRNRDHNLWWSGTAVSALGTSVSRLAFPLLVLAATGSAAAAGVVGTCASAGLAAGLLPAGVVADRCSRRALLVEASLIQLTVMAAVCWQVAVGHLWLPLIAFLALVQGLASAVFAGAAAPLVRRIVPGAQLRTAFARAEVRDQSTQLAGAPLGGTLFALARWAPFLADALSYAAVTLACLLIRTPMGPDPAERAARRPPLRRDLLAGLVFVRGVPFLRYTLLWSALMNLLITGTGFMFIVTLRQHGASSSEIGSAEGIATACGLGGALASGWVVRRVGGHRLVLLVSWMLVCGVAGLVPLAGRPWAAGLCLGASIVLLTPLNAVFGAAMVAMVPDAMAARVLTSVNMAVQSCGWLAPVLCGALADAFGVRAPLIVIAAGLALLAAANHLVPAMGQLDRIGADGIGTDGVGTDGMDEGGTGGGGTGAPGADAGVAGSRADPDERLAR